jgi:hypothetical protein
VIGLLIALAAAAVPALAPEASWSLDPSWDDGRAEVAVYEAHRRVYGRDRVFETVILTVKEEMDARTGVKADPPLEGRPLVTVLKANIISGIPTENYTYHFMTSLFVRRDDPFVLMKLAHSSQEWCGTTYKQVAAWDGPPHLAQHSYFDGQADSRTPLPLGRDLLIEDHLLVAARGLRLEGGAEAPLRIYGSLVSHTASEPAARPSTARGARTAPFETPAGIFPARRIDIVQEGGAVMTFWVEDAPRAALLGFDSSDGRSLRLKKIGRRDYWSR